MNIFNPINQYQSTSSNEIRFTNDERRSGNSANPINQFNFNNPFNPVNRYRPENPLAPINELNPGVPFAPLGERDGGGEVRRSL